MIERADYPRIFSKVHNRGVPPVGFVSSLVETIRKIPDEVFGVEYKSTREPDIYQFVVTPTQSDLLRVLGGYESSWAWNEGRDVTNPASNLPETTEAGVFQCSANSVNFDKSLVECFNRFADSTGLARWKNMRASGEQFQWMTKAIPAYAIEHCARLLRFTIRHHGPVVRGEILPWLSLDAVREFERLLSPNTAPIMPTIPTTKKIAYIIDPGHGGADSGAVSSFAGKHHKESDIVLRVGRRLQSLLTEDGRFAASMTRSSDEFVSLAERVRLANAAGAKLVSIHANAGGGTGFEAFTSPGQTESDLLATALLDAYGAEFPGWTLRADWSDGDPDKEARFTVLTQTRGPAVLFELGFMDRPDDLRRMLDPVFVDRAASALYRGILKHEGLAVLGVVKPDVPEPEEEPDADEAALIHTDQGIRLGFEMAIEHLEALARENEDFKELLPSDPAFWDAHRKYLTGFLGAEFLRKNGI